MNTEPEILDYLNSRQFSYQRIEHPPVYTCAEAELYRPDLPACSTKNLFLCDKRGKAFYLIVTDCAKTLDLKELGVQLNIPKLRFASEANLERLLGVTPGAVTMLALVNDSQHEVELWIDSQVWAEEHFLCHPLVNTATLVLSKADLTRFFALSGHPLHFYNSAAAQ